ncbi:SDR family NAD(P)-dependent oxidoreductase [Maricaulis sp.]|jgi:O-antigen biosynthesis protein WbqV|uniref:SDR family NAD(P)-dependent oxidoreductase n=1 Tax=Maricaulis sp. TaxID=1486257 RepID=UPI002633139C|nr:SDR family NAD(P)-dependent oxidoreductase [Maricaulis sp.]
MTKPRPGMKDTAAARNQLSMVAVALFDLAAGAFSMWAAVHLRYRFEPTDPPDQVLLQSVAVFALACALVFPIEGLHRGLWRYTALNDAARVIRATLVANLVFLPVLFLINRLDGFPRTSILIDIPILIGLLLAPRFLVAALRTQGLRGVLQVEDRSKPAAILVGTEAELDDALRDIIRRNGSAPFRPKGLIEPQSDLTGHAIRGVPVLGGMSAIEPALERLARAEAEPPRLVLAGTVTDVEIVNELIRIAAQTGAKLSRARPADGPGAFSPVEAADLLNRPPRPPNLEPARPLIEGKRVLITGAGGTIGSQLARLAATLNPEKLIFFDASEANLYEIDLEFTRRAPRIAWRAVLGDIRDTDRLDTVFGEEKPDVVLHAAALKHVPMSELNPGEAVRTNVIGTVNTIEAAKRHKARIVALISTDKAVNPSNIMGATKRAAELYARAAATDGSDTRICVVRFGNVLGSTGSVVPLFERQIEAGDPVTVTDPEATRYFMTVEEASGLVLDAAAQTAFDPALNGALYVLDMGKPISILRLARQLLRLRGRDPDVPGAISIVGLRPGEKRHESLVYDFESRDATSVDGVWSITGPTLDADMVAQALDTLLQSAESGHREPATAALETLCALRPRESAGLT